MEPIQKLGAAEDEAAVQGKTTEEIGGSSLVADSKATTSPDKLQIAKSTSEIGQSSSATK
jgi:hypothetical protein